ncbi:hypothetical protein ACJJTC_017674 [Scirpophaga incertulas]
MRVGVAPLTRVCALVWHPNSCTRVVWCAGVRVAGRAARARARRAPARARRAPPRVPLLRPRLHGHYNNLLYVLTHKVFIWCTGACAARATTCATAAASPTRYYLVHRRVRGARHHVCHCCGLAYTVTITIFFMYSHIRYYLVHRRVRGARHHVCHCCGLAYTVTITIFFMYSHIRYYLVHRRVRGARHHVCHCCGLAYTVTITIFFMYSHIRYYLVHRRVRGARHHVCHCCGLAYTVTITIFFMYSHIRYLFGAPARARRAPPRVPLLRPRLHGHYNNLLYVLTHKVLFGAPARARRAPPRVPLLRPRLHGHYNNLLYVLTHKVFIWCTGACAARATTCATAAASPTRYYLVHRRVRGARHHVCHCCGLAYTVTITIFFMYSHIRYYLVHRRVRGARHHVCHCCGLAYTVTITIFFMYSHIRYYLVHRRVPPRVPLLRPRLHGHYNNLLSVLTHKVLFGAPARATTCATAAASPTRYYLVHRRVPPRVPLLRPRLHGHYNNLLYVLTHKVLFGAPARARRAPPRVPLLRPRLHGHYNYLLYVLTHKVLFGAPARARRAPPRVPLLRPRLHGHYNNLLYVLTHKVFIWCTGACAARATTCATAAASPTRSL